jgi:hypothetical protein
MFYARFFSFSSIQIQERTLAATKKALKEFNLTTKKDEYGYIHIIENDEHIGLIERC